MNVRSIVVGALLLTGLAVATPPADAARPQVQFRNGKLLVVGTAGDNTIVVTRSKRAVKVKVDGKKIKFRPKIKPGKLKAITVSAGGGNDTVVLREAAGPLPEAKLQGGPGNDHLAGGSGSTRLIGQDGDDELVAGAGPTRLEGGSGADHLTGGPGAATMIAGDGDDVVFGGAGPATIEGGPGNDTFNTGTGTATIDGGVGDDRLNGGPGPVVMNGNDGSDNLAAGTSTSAVLTGGNAADTFSFGVGAQAFAAGTVTDFGNGADLVDLFTGLSVHTGLGTTTVTVWDGVIDDGTISATNGHLWAAGDFG